MEVNEPLVARARAKLLSTQKGENKPYQKGHKGQDSSN